MPRLRWVLALLLLIPLADALFLVVVADAVGWQVTVALVVLTGLLGMLLVRAEGRHTLRRFQRKLSTGEIPTNEALDGALLIAAGAFLLTPGLVTDAVGVLLTVPLTRYPIREVLKRVVVRPYLDRRMDGFVTGNVWTAGFPQEEYSASSSSSSTATSTAAGSDTDFVDVDGGPVDDDGDRDRRTGSGSTDNA